MKTNSVSKPKLDLIQFFNDVEIQYLRQIGRDANPPTFEILKSFETVHLTKRRVTLDRFSPKQEADFLFHFAKGIQFLNSIEEKQSVGRSRRQINETLESLIKLITASPNLLISKTLGEIKIRNPKANIYRWDSSKIVPDEFLRSFIGLLITIRNQNHFDENFLINESLDQLPFLLVWYFKNVKGNKSSKKQINFTQLAIFLSQHFFKVDRYAFLVDLINTPEILPQFPVKKGNVISKDDLTSALTSLKKQKKTWPKEV